MEIDRDGEMSRGDGPDAPVGAPGHRVPRRHTLVFTAPAPSAPSKSGAGQPGSPARGGAIRPVFLGIPAAVYQVLREEMQEELDSDRRFFTENPNRAHMVRAAFPIEALFLREQAHILEGPGTIPDGKIVMVVKQLAPGLRLRLRLPPGMADDEDHSRRLWTQITGG